MPAPVAWVVRVAMMSSASNPSSSRCRMCSASSTSLINGSWLLNSSGVLLRLALYSGYCSSRKVCRDMSNATPTWVGCSSRSTLISIEVNP